MSLQDKVVLVTGAGTGIGRGISVEFARRKARVGINYHLTDEQARETLRLVEDAGSVGLPVHADVSNPQQVREMVREVAHHYGRIDILVNNAATQPNMGLIAYEEAAYEEVMRVNLLGYFHCIQAVIPIMKAMGQGRIINISSVHGKRPTDFDAVYAMTKGGIKMLARESAIELAKYGITVNTIEPGAIDAGPKFGKPRPIVPADKVTDEGRWRSQRKFPLGRVGLPSDIARLACFLASDEAEFITGASIRADGGSMLL